MLRAHAVLPYKAPGWPMMQCMVWMRMCEFIVCGLRRIHDALCPRGCVQIPWGLPKQDVSDTLGALSLACPV